MRSVAVGWFVLVLILVWPIAGALAWLACVGSRAWFVLRPEDQT